MARILHLGALLLACLTALAEQKEGGKAAAQPRPAGKVFPKSGGVPKPGNPRLGRGPMGAPMSNPASPAARLYRATPEERDRALEKLPPRMQQQLRTQLERFDALPKPQQEVFIRRAERFAALSPEQQTTVRQQIAALNRLPAERKGEIGRTLRTLQSMSEEERRRVVESEEFKTRFSPEEQKIIGDLSEVMLPPM